MVLVRRKRMERRGNNTGGASLPLHCQGRFLRLTVDHTQAVTCWRFTPCYIQTSTYMIYVQPCFCKLNTFNADFYFIYFFVFFLL